MNLTIVKTLPKGEQSLIMDTRPKRIDRLSEDELLDLHARVRRGRNKYKKNYRRSAASRVKADRARGSASKKSRADAQRAEVFEEALARVSERLAKAARKEATALRKKRLGAAKAQKATRAKAKERAAARATAKTKAKGKTSKASSKSSAKATKKAKRTSTKTPVRKKAVAGQRATKARNNAKRRG